MGDRRPRLAGRLLAVVPELVAYLPLALSDAALLLVAVLEVRDVDRWPRDRLHVLALLREHLALRDVLGEHLALRDVLAEFCLMLSPMADDREQRVGDLVLDVSGRDAVEAVAVGLLTQLLDVVLAEA